MAVSNINEVAKVIQMPGTVRVRGAASRRRDSVLADLEALPQYEQDLWRLLIKLAAGCRKKGKHAGTPFLVGGDVGTSGNTIAGWTTVSEKGGAS